MSDAPKNNPQTTIRYIMLAVFIWGAALALGALLFGYDEASGDIRFAPNVWRGLIPLVCVGIFLGSWALLLARRRSA